MRGRPVEQRSSSGGVGDANNDIVEERRKGEDGQVVSYKYLKGKLLGKGGFAKCYLGTSIPSKEQYALKIVLKSTLSKPKAKQKLQSEIRIHRSLDHNGVVKFERFFEDRHSAFILLELCKNNSMSELMKRRKQITEPEARFYVLQLCSALKYLHRNNIIHRDLKLGNIFLDGNMRVKVGDFGLAARLSSPSERRMTLCGTPNYIAPEILQRKNGHSFEVDIWSTGIILYTLLCGRPPYESKDVDSTYKRILHNSYSFPDHTDVSDAAKLLIQSILQLKPENRLTISQIESHNFFTSRDVYTPQALTSAAMKEIPPSCIPLSNKAENSAHQARGKAVFSHKHAGNEENDPGAINRAPPSLRNINRDCSPPRKVPHVHPKSERPHSSKRDCPVPDLALGEEEKKNGREVSLKPTRGNALRGGASGSCFADRRREKEAPPLPSQPHQDLPPPPPAAEPLAKRGYSRQFEIYSDKMQSAGRARSGSCSGDKERQGKQEQHQDHEQQQQEEMGGYQLEGVETIGGEMEEDEEVDLLQRSLEQCGIRQPSNEQQQEEQQEPKKESLTTPAAARREGNPDTLECMFETLEQSLLSGREPSSAVGGGQRQLETQLLQADQQSEPRVWVVRHVDYTSKYGLGFLLNTGSAGVYFNDSTKIVLDPKGSVFHYVERRRRSSGAVEHSSETHRLDSHPPELNKKVTLLKHFRNYLVDQQSQEPQSENEKREGLEEKEEAEGGDSDMMMPYVKKWVRTRHAILFRLSNKTVQVVFFDQSEILLSSEARVVSFVNKDGQRSSHTLDSVFRNGRTDIAKRLKYTKDIMSRLINLQQQPRGR